MTKVLAMALMLVAAAGFYRYMQMEADRRAQRVGGAPRQALDNVRDAAKRIEREEAARVAAIDKTIAE